MKIWTVILLFWSCIGVAQESWKVYELAHWSDSMQQLWYQDMAYNEVWGFVQGEDEYAVIGSADGTTILKIEDDNSLKHVQFIQGRELNAIHRDYHDFNGYLYEVCDEGFSTLRIYDLQYLPDSVSMIYDDSTLIRTCHNIFIDESSGMLYACGIATQSQTSPLRLLSLNDPANPTFVYDYTFVDYVHDIYVRNDTAFINAAFEGLRVADFSNPVMPMPLGSLEFYTDKGYNHSGWLSEDGKTYVMCDETTSKRFKILDVSDLSDIQEIGLAKPPTFYTTLPHNVMLKDGIAYFSYYNDGLQIYDIRKKGEINRIGYFDSYQKDTIAYHGAWGVYSFLPSERLLLSDRKNGLYLLGFDAPPDLSETTFEYSLYPNFVTEGYTYFYKDHKGVADYNLEIYDARGALIDIVSGDTDYLKIDTKLYRAGIYLFKYVSNTSDLVGVGKFFVQNL